MLELAMSETHDHLIMRNVLLSIFLNQNTEALMPKNKNA